MRALVRITKEGMAKVMDANSAEDFKKAEEIKLPSDLILNCVHGRTCDEIIADYNQTLKKPEAARKKAVSKFDNDKIRKKIDEGVLLWDLKKVTEENWKFIFDHVLDSNYMPIFELHNSKEWTKLNYCCDSYKYHVAKNLIEAKSVEVPEEVIQKALKDSGRL